MGIPLKNGGTLTIQAISLTGSSGNITLGTSPAGGGNGNAATLTLTGTTMNGIAGTILSNFTSTASTLTIQDDVLQKVAPASLKIQRFEDDSTTVAAFISQQTQLLATGAAVAAAAIQKNPQVQAEYKLLLKDSPNFIGVRKGETALLNRVNEILRAAKADGTLEQYSQKWLGRGTGVLPD